MRQRKNKIRKVKVEPEFRLIHQMYATRLCVLAKAFSYILYNYNIFKVQAIFFTNTKYEKICDHVFA